MSKKLNYTLSAPRCSWSILSCFLGNNKIVSIPPIPDGKVMSNFKEQANLFHSIFAFQSKPVSNCSMLPDIRYHTNIRLSSFNITKQDILPSLSH